MHETSDSPAAHACGFHHRYRIGDDPEAPLVIMVHGRAGNASVMWAFRRCVPDSFSIILPQAPLNDPIGGYSWWEIGTDSTRADAELARQKLSGFIECTIGHYKLRPKFVLAYGFSQGAGLLSLILQHNSQTFAGVALLAGFVFKQDNPHLAEPLPEIFIAHGDQDRAVPLAKAREGERYLTSLGYEVDFYTDPVGHKVGTSGMKALKEWTYSFL